MYVVEVRNLGVARRIPTLRHSEMAEIGTEIGKRDLVRNISQFQKAISSGERLEIYIVKHHEAFPFRPILLLLLSLFRTLDTSAENNIIRVVHLH